MRPRPRIEVHVDINEDNSSRHKTYVNIKDNAVKEAEGRQRHFSR